METTTVTIDIPDSFIKDCKDYNISAHQMLQMFTTQLATVCTMVGGNEDLLIAQTTAVFMDFLDTVIMVPIPNKAKRDIGIKLTKTLVAMTFTEVIEWSEEKYVDLINDAYKKLLHINKKAGK